MDEFWRKSPSFFFFSNALSRRQREMTRCATKALGSRLVGGENVPAFRHLLATSALCFALVLNHAAADPDDDNRRPGENAGIYVQVIDDGTNFESHPVADTALKAKKIDLVASPQALNDLLAKRGKAGGAIVIVDGAQMLLNPTEAYVKAYSLVKNHGKNATYIFLNEPSRRVLPVILRDTPLTASGPINASGLVDLAIRDAIERKEFSAAEAPERLTIVTKSRAEAVLKNTELGRTSTPGDAIPWPSGHKIAVLSRAVFERDGGSPTTLSTAIVKATAGEKVAYIAYEMLGGESAVTGNRMLQLASECRVAINREVPFRITLYALADDPRSAVVKLAASKTEWLAKLNGAEHLPGSGTHPDVKFSVEPVQSLYGRPMTVDGEQTVTVKYHQRGTLGIFGGGERLATFKLRYENGRVIVSSDADYPGVKVRANKNDGIIRTIQKGQGELEALEGPAVEVRIDTTSGEKMSVMLVDPRHRTEVVGALLPRTAPDYVAAAETYTRVAADVAPAPAPTTGGGAAVVPSPDRRLAPRIADPSVFDPLRQFFPPLNEAIRKNKPPYALASKDPLKDFERKTLVAKRGMIVFVIPDGVSPRETLNRLLYEVTVTGDVPGLPRNQHFAELRPSLIESKYVGETANRLETVNKVADKQHVYLVAYDLTTLTALGRHSENPTNELKTLLPGMENDRVTLVTAATSENLENFLKLNPEFRTVIGKVEVPKVTDAYVFSVMDAYSDREGRPRVPDALKKDFIEVSNRFSARGGQPERVIDFLANYYPIADDLNFREINQASLRGAAATHYGLTAEDFDPELKKQRIERVRGELNSDIIGMGHVKDAVIEYLDNERREYYRGRRYPSFLLAGPPGLAKTVIVRKVAKGIVGDRFHEINMGGPAGQSIGVLYRAIADAVSKNADAVIFLDEIEKASREVQEALLKPMWDRVLDYQPNANSTQMERISLHSVRFFAASNAATDYLQEVVEKYDVAEHEKAKAAGKGDEYLKSVFNDANFRESIKFRILDSLLSRFEHHVYPVFPLTKENFEKLVVLKISMLDTEFSNDRYVGPVQAVNAREFAKELADKLWSRKIDIRNIEGQIRDSYMRALGRAQDAAGRAPGVEVPRDCQKLLIELVYVPK